MKSEYSKFIENSFDVLVENVLIPKLQKQFDDGKISVYRVKDIIRIDIKDSKTVLPEKQTERKKNASIIGALVFCGHGNGNSMGA